MKKIIPFLFFVFALSFNTSGQPIRGQAFTTNQYPGLRGRGSDGAVLLGSDAYVPTAKLEITGSNTLRAFVVNTNQMVITNGLTGLGTNNPIARLHVVATDRAIISTGIVHRFESGSANNLVITNGRVGLKTSSPNVQFELLNESGDLEVRFTNSAAASDTILRLTKTTANNSRAALVVANPAVNWYAGLLANTASRESFSFSTNNTDAIAYLNILKGGNIGVSTNDPQEKLHIANLTANSDPAIRISNDAQSWNLQTYGSGYDGFQIKDVTGNKTPFKIQPGCADNSLVLTNGWLGFGTAYPQNQVHILKASDNQLAVDATGQYSTINFKYLGANKGQIYTDNTGNTLSMISGDAGFAGQIILGTGNGSEKIRITSTGNVGIGTTTPQQKLHVAGSVQLHNNIYHSTNAALGGAVVDMSRMCQVTNAGGNIIWTGLSGTTPTNYCRSIVYVYADGADRSVTWPASWKNKDIATVYYVTNGWHAKIEIEVIGDSLTNVSYQLIR